MKKKAGRDSKGRFASGNKLGKGNPYAAKIAEYRAALTAEIKAADVKKIVRALIRKAVDGDVAAIKILLDRILGAPVPSDLLEKIEQMEAIVEEMDGSKS